MLALKMSTPKRYKRISMLCCVMLISFAVYDASVKVPTGVEYGAVYQFGNFDQCMDINSNKAIKDHAEDGTDIKPKYCLADVTMDGYNVRSGAVRKFELNNSTLVHWGFCLPAVCSSRDAEILISLATGHKNVTIHNDQCQTNDATKLTSIDVFYGCVILAMVLMVLFCTFYHFCMYINTNYKEVKPRGGLERTMMAFSIIENMQKLVKGSRDELGLSAVNGIKAFAMIFIIIGHALLFMVGGPTMNSEFYAMEIHLVQNAFLTNSPLLVDTFLLLSGFLFAHLLLVELEKRNGKVNFLVLYIFRYIRLTPAYLAVIALYATWLPKIGSGPLWASRVGIENSRCQSSWWINLLYINNYVGTDKLCMFQSWYLATDTQLFILAPLVLYPLWKWRRMGVSALSMLAIASILIPLITTYVNDTDPSFLPYTDEISDISANEFFINTYIKTHMRATSYLFGLFTGYLVHYIKEKKFRFSRMALWILWVASIVIGIASLFSIVVFFGTNYSRTIRSLYAGLHRLGWSFATSWIILASVLDYAGPLKSILSSRALVPLSRLTYCAYLSNGLVELYQAGSIRTPKYMSTINLLGETLSHVLLTFIGALILCLIFESPIHGVERIFLRKDTQKQQQRSDSSLSPTALRNTESA